MRRADDRTTTAGRSASMLRLSWLVGALLCCWCSVWSAPLVAGVRAQTCLPVNSVLQAASLTADTWTTSGATFDTYNGKPTIVLTAGTASSAVATGAWFKFPIYAQEGFRVSFQFKISTGNLEGFAFVMAAQELLQPSTTGVGDLGYAIANSIAVEIDLTVNPAILDNPIVPHVEWHTMYTGVNSPTGSVSQMSQAGGSLVVLPAGDHSAVITFDPSQPYQLSISFDGLPAIRGQLGAKLAPLWQIANGSWWIGFTSTADPAHNGAIQIFGVDVSTIDASAATSVLSPGASTSDRGIILASDTNTALRGTLTTFSACGLRMRRSYVQTVVTMRFLNDQLQPIPMQTAIVDNQDGTYDLFYGNSFIGANRLNFTAEVFLNDAAVGSPRPMTLVAGPPNVGQTVIDPLPTMMVAGNTVRFNIQLKDAWANPALPVEQFFIGILGPAGAGQRTSTDADPTDPTRILVAYTPPQTLVAGAKIFMINGTLGGVFAQNMVALTADVYSPANTTYTNVLTPITAGYPSRTITGVVHDQFGNPVVVTPATMEAVVAVACQYVAGSHPSLPPPSLPAPAPITTLVGQADGFQFMFGGPTITIAGAYRLTVTFQEAPAYTKELLMQVAPHLPARADIVQPITTVTATSAAFSMFTFDQYSNPCQNPADGDAVLHWVVKFSRSGNHQLISWEAACTLTSSPAPPVVDANGMSAQCTWNYGTMGYDVLVGFPAESAGLIFAIEIQGPTVGGNLVTPTNSIFNVPIDAAPPDAAASVIYIAPPTTATAGVPASFDLQLRNADGSMRDSSLVDSDTRWINVTVYRYSGKQLATAADATAFANITGILPMGDGQAADQSYRVEFVAGLAGEYRFQIQLGPSPMPAARALRTQVVPGAMSPLATKYAAVSSAAKAGKPFVFSLQLQDAYGNVLVDPNVAQAQITFILATGQAFTGVDSVVFQSQGKFLVTIVPPSNAQGAKGAKFILQPTIDGQLAAVLRIIVTQDDGGVVTDPCQVPYQPCGQAATCSAAALSLTKATSNSTAVCTPVLEVKKIDPQMAPAVGGQLVTMTLVDLVPDTLVITIMGEVIPYTVDSRSPNQVTLMSPDGGAMGMSVPMTSTGMPLPFNLTAYFYQNASTPQVDPLTGLPVVNILQKYTRLIPQAMLMVNTSCIMPGYFWIMSLGWSPSACVPCSAHAYCPGGAKAWPLPGYYSTSEAQQEPTACMIADACLGYDRVAADTTLGYQWRPDSQCASGRAAYLCSQCDAEHYLSNQMCLSCNLDSASHQKLVLTIVAAFVLFTLLALGVAFINNERLGLFVQAVVFIQQLSFVGQIGASRLSSSTAVDFFSFLALFNFEITLFRSGCQIPQVTYLQVFFGTLVMILIAAVLLAMASGLFALTRKQEYLDATGITRRKVFRWRVQNSLCVLGVVIYLQLTTQLVRGVFCITVADKLVLGVEPTTQCYTGSHAAAASLIWPALFIYSLGFPLLCLWLVLRTRHWNLWSSAAAKFNYLYRNLKIDFIWFKCITFLTSGALAIQMTITTSGNNAAVRLATACLFFGVHVFLVALIRPFVHFSNNALVISGGLANAISGLALLSVVSSGSSSDPHRLGALHDWSLFGVGIGVLSFLLLCAIPGRLLLLRYFPESDSREEDELLQAGRYKELAALRIKNGRGTQRVKEGQRLEQVYKEQPDVPADSTDDFVLAKNPAFEVATPAASATSIDVAAPLQSPDAIRSDDAQMGGIEMQQVTMTPEWTDQ